MRTTSAPIPRCPPSLHGLPGKGGKHPIPRCPPMHPALPGKGPKHPIPRCPPRHFDVFDGPKKK